MGLCPLSPPTPTHPVLAAAHERRQHDLSSMEMNALRISRACECRSKWRRGIDRLCTVLTEIVIEPAPEGDDEKVFYDVISRHPIRCVTAGG